MKNIALPEFDPSNDLHLRLAQASEQAHERVSRGESIESEQEQIDRLAEELWNTKR